MADALNGSCFCGAVEIEARGAPIERLLPLQILSILFRRACERLHFVEGGECNG